MFRILQDHFRIPINTLDEKEDSFFPFKKAPRYLTVQNCIWSNKKQALCDNEIFFCRSKIKSREVHRNLPWFWKIGKMKKKRKQKQSQTFSIAIFSYTTIYIYKPLPWDLEDHSSKEGFLLSYNLSKFEPVRFHHGSENLFRICLSQVQEIWSLWFSLVSSDHDFRPCSSFFALSWSF